MKTKGLEETKPARDVVLLPARSLLPQQWVRLEIMGAGACSEPGAGWPRQSFSYWGFVFWLAAWALLLARLQAVGPSSVPSDTETVPWPRSSGGHRIPPAKNSSAV